MVHAHAADWRRIALEQSALPDSSDAYRLANPMMCDTNASS